MQTTTGTLTLPDAQIVYDVTGDGFPLTLIHAGVADRRLWDAQVPFFSEAGYQVIRYDLRGFGETRSQTKEGFSDADDLLALLDTLKIQRTHLLGLSRGGALAIDFTLAHPERVSALIPVASGLSGLDATPSDTEVAFWEEAEKVEATGDLDKLNELEIHLWLDGLHRVGTPVDPTVREKMLMMNGNALKHPDGSLTPKRADPPALARLSLITTPTFVIWGDGDTTGVKQASIKMIESIPNVRYQVFFDVAHMVNLDRPAEFNRIVLGFLRSLPVETPA